MASGSERYAKTNAKVKEAMIGRAAAGFKKTAAKKRNPSFLPKGIKVKAGESAPF